MALYLVQHGLALTKAEDPKRSLSPDGKREIEQIAEYLNKLGITINQICHSGKTRAEETANIFAEKLGTSIVKMLPGMAPKDDVKEFAANLNPNETMYVGHLPHLGKLASFLLTNDENAEIIKFTNGGVVCLEKDDTGFNINWILIPSLCKS